MKNVLSDETLYLLKNIFHFCVNENEIEWNANKNESRIRKRKTVTTRLHLLYNEFGHAITLT